MKILSFIILCLLLPVSAFATIYSAMNKQGQVFFTDNPSADMHAKPISLETIQTYRATDLPKNILSNTEKSNPSLQINIVSPQMDETIRENQGNIKITLHIQPRLQSSAQHIQLLMDGKAVSNSQTATTFLLQNVDRGTHKLQALILDNAGNILAQSPTIIFHLQRFHIKKQFSVVPISLPLSGQQIEALQRMEGSLVN